MSQFSIKLPNSFKLIHLGKIRPNSPRPLKLIFGSRDNTEHLLSTYNEAKKSGSTLPPDFRVVKDKTPLQRMLLRNCHFELDLRSNAGENDLRISYVDGILKVVSSQSMNKKLHHHQTGAIH